MKTEYSDDIFSVSGKYGFLPSYEPLDKLPEEYNEIQNIINQLPHFLHNEGTIEKAIESLPNLNNIIINETNKQVLQAIYRAYTFASSGYLLAPAHFNKDSDGKYGKAYNVLPSQLAMPLVTVSNKLDVFPWLDYHYAYSLGNYVKKDKEGTLHWDNLKMACSFTGTDDEVGFIMNHVYINEVSPQLVFGIFQTLSGEVKEGLKQVLDTIREMNERRRTMWKASRPERYNDFRAFIMGIEGNEEIFGEGVIYEGVWEEPRKYRGQTGAQDDIIPSLDIFTGVIKYYPDNMLTKYLLDLRNYRPKCVQEYFKDLEIESPEYRKNLTKEEKVLLLGILEQVYYFRSGHWNFVVQYIMKNTKYAKATGGTPIISWIPNQIAAVLSYMKDIVDEMGDHENNLYGEIRGGLRDKIELLNNQIEELRKTEYNVERLYDMFGNLDDKKVKF